MKKLLSMAKLLLIYYTLCAMCLSEVKSLQYSDLEAMNVSCGEKDSCLRSKGSRLNFPLNWRERNCFCDNLCDYYGDCCINAATYSKKDAYEGPRHQDCLVLRNYGGVYMRRQCSAKWHGSDQSVEKLCKAARPESGQKRPDPWISLPVTSKTTKLTYANYYCALCNNDADNIQVWWPRVECPTIVDRELRRQLNTSAALETLTFKNSSWGIYINVEGNKQYHLCTIDPYIPETVVQDVRLCKEMISTCPTNYHDEEVLDLCSSYTSLLYSGTVAYRNYHCALCNNETVDTLSCFNRSQLIRFHFSDDFNPATFSLLFDFTDTGGGNFVGFKCNPSEIYDPFFKKCRNVLCAEENAFYNNGRCESTSANDDIELIFGDLNATETKSPNVSLVYHIHNEINTNGTHKSQNIIIFPNEIISTTPSDAGIFTEKNVSILNCSRILIPQSEFEHKDDNSIYITKYDQVLPSDQYELHDGGVLICLFASNTEKFSKVMGWVTVVGLGISFACLLLHLIAFILVPDLRNLSGKNLSSLSIALLGAYSCFILGVFGEENKTECVVLASLMYYFFLASFCWMNVLSFDIWRSLRMATNELRVSAGEQWKKFFAYCTYAWLTPALALTVVLAIDLVQPDSIHPSYLPNMGQRLCWFGQRNALLVFFAAPLSVIMLLNIMFFVMAARMIASTAQSAAKLSSCQQPQGYFKLYIRLALLMGLAWISGIMAGYFQEDTLWYVFIIFNTLQGAFIFAAFTCKRKTFEYFCGSCALSRKLNRPASSSARGNLESRDSNNSHLSHSSEAQLTPPNDTSSTSISL